MPEPVCCLKSDRIIITYEVALFKFAEVFNWEIVWRLFTKGTNWYYYANNLFRCEHIIYPMWGGNPRQSPSFLRVFSFELNAIAFKFCSDSFNNLPAKVPGGDLEFKAVRFRFEFPLPNWNAARIAIENDINATVCSQRTATEAYMLLQFLFWNARIPSFYVVSWIHLFTKPNVSQWAAALIISESARPLRKTAI